MARKYSPRRVYSEQEKQDFLELAKEVGLSKAMRDLNYPTPATADKWAKESGMEIPKSLVHQMARLNQYSYSVEERLAVVNNVIEVTVEQLNQPGLTPIDLKRIVESYKTATETYNLIQGKATSITQKADAFDTEYVNLLEQMRKQNEEFESTE